MNFIIKLMFYPLFFFKWMVLFCYLCTCFIFKLWFSYGSAILYHAFSVLYALTIFLSDLIKYSCILMSVCRPHFCWYRWLKTPKIESRVQFSDLLIKKASVCILYSESEEKLHLNLKKQFNRIKLRHAWNTLHTIVSLNKRVSTNRSDFEINIRLKGDL